MNHGKKLFSYALFASRQFTRPLVIHGSGGGRVRPQFKRMKLLQKKFQIDDGMPVWYKTKGDRLLFTATVSLIGVGLVMSLYTVLWEISYVKHFRPYD